MAEPTSDLSHPFVKVGKWRCLVHFEQNAFRLLYYLLFKTKPLALGVYSRSWKRNLKGVVKAFAYSLELFIKQVKARFSSFTPTFIYLSVRGHVGLSGHDSVAIFDLETNEVIKVFSEHATLYFQHELAKHAEAEGLGLSEPLLAINSEHLWYKKRYINGKPLRTKGWTEFKKVYNHSLLPLLCHLLKSGQPQQASATYKEALLRGAKESLAKLKEQAPEQNLRDVRGFVDALSKRLDKSFRPYLVSSHGDFQGANILDSDELILIDWETLDKRSALYDLFYLFSEELFSGRSFAAETTYPESLREAVMKGVSQLRQGLADTKHITDYLELYFDFFRLERIAHELSFRLLLNQPSAKIVDSLNKLITVFEKYENALFD